MSPAQLLRAWQARSRWEGAEWPHGERPIFGRAPQPTSRCSQDASPPRESLEIHRRTRYLRSAMDWKEDERLRTATHNSGAPLLLPKIRLRLDLDGCSNGGA